MRSRGGILGKVRRPGAAITLWVWALSMLAPSMAPRRAEANMDPLRVVTSQVIRPNILVVLDTSGSMVWRPDQSTNVGGDCYNGTSCVTTPQSNTCTSGLACDPANTCNDGSSCTVGTNGYCANGTACSNGAMCGSGASQTLCPSTTNTCHDGSACQQSCGISGTSCATNANCTAQTCNSTTLSPVSTTTYACSNNSAQSCTVATDCGTVTTCYGTCSGGTKSGKTCSVAGDCPGSGGSCKTSSSYRNCATGVGISPGGTSCSSVGTSCGPTCDGTTVTTGHCAKSPYGTCTTSSDCPGWSNSCNTGSFSVKTCSLDSASCTVDSDCAANACTGTPTCNAATTGSAVCGLWCSDGTACSAAQDYCPTSTGGITACSQICPDGSTCSTVAHCGASACPTTPQVYKGSSRIAIAKHVISNVLDSMTNLVNFGFMTYDQTNYFPYVRSSTTSTQTNTDCFNQGDLQDMGGWSSNAPVASFTNSKGTTYTLVATGGAGNSKYQTGKKNKQTAQHDFCGTQCVFSSATWSFQQACYTSTKSVNTGTLTQSIQTTYLGPTATIGGQAYTYYPFSPTDTGPIAGESFGWGGGSSVCDSTTSVLADGNVRVPLTLSNTPATRAQVISDTKKWLQTMSSGGLVPAGGTPIGCTLQYNYATSGSAPAGVGIDNDAYSYLASVKASDTLGTCRNNFVILVTDGEPNGPDDTTAACSAAACATPSLAGCTCASVLAAKHLKDDLGVKTYMVGFGSETVGSTSLDNIARAGGSCRSNGCAFSAGSEQALNDALNSAIFDALKGDYATSAPTVASSTGSAYGGDIAILASTEFPSWRGHIRATDVVHLNGSGQPTLLWDAGNLLATRTWNTRNIYTSDPTTNALVPLYTAGATNSAALYALGLGASATEADTIIQGVMGNGLDWKLGALFNVTGVSVSNNIDLPFTGHAAFATAHSTRPKMLYVGADDGMLHAFFFETGPNSEPAGSEAWAYIPPEQLPSITALYARGGQNADPTTHIYGIASSPKVHDACTAPCSAQSDWKTVLVSGAGPGSTNYFGLDITNPTATTPFAVMWRSATASNFSGKVGQSWSVPAFAFTGSGSSFQSVLMFGSGYDTTPSDGLDQGNYTFMVNPITGANVSAPFHITSPGGTITTFSVLADLAVANNAGTLKAIAGYQADLAGRIWRFGTASSAPSSALYDAGVTHPFYYSPAASSLNATDVVLAAADKTFDDIDMNPLSGSVSTPNLYVMVDRGGTVSAATPIPFTSLCKTTCHARSCAGCPTFDTLARPVSSPILLTNLDSAATAPLQVMLEIYQPVANSCSLGGTSLVVVDVDTSSTTPSLTQSEGKTVPGAGRSAGIFIGAGGVLVSASSGMGNNASSVSVVAGAPATISSSSGGGVSTARLVGISETDN